MRLSLVCVILAACGSTSGPAGEGSGEAGDESLQPLPVTRIVYRQYYPGSPIFVLENLGGRNLVELRSEPLVKGKPPVAYVPDWVMVKLMAEFEDQGLPDYLKPRPRNPKAMGGVAELTLIARDGTMRSFIRTRSPKGQQPSKQYQALSKTYLYCVESFRVVWDAYRPYAQVSEGVTGEFGVRKAEFGGR